MGLHLLVKAKLNGKSVTLVLDTGASQTVFDYQNAKQSSENKAEQLHDGSSTGVGGEQLQSHIIQVEKFKIGDVVIRDKHFVLLDLQYVNAQYEKIGKPAIQGVLGGDVLNAFNAVIDYKKGVLVLNYKKGS